MNAWNEPAPVFERSLLRHELFELFLTNIEIDRICNESTNYACLKGNHMSTMTLEKLKAFLTIFLVKAFLTILLVIGYARVSRQDMYWEGQEECHNPKSISNDEENRVYRVQTIFTCG